MVVSEERVCEKWNTDWKGRWSKINTFTNIVTPLCAFDTNPPAPTTGILTSRIFTNVNQFLVIWSHCFCFQLHAMQPVERKLLSICSFLIWKFHWRPRLWWGVKFGGKLQWCQLFCLCFKILTNCGRYFVWTDFNIKKCVCPLFLSLSVLMWSYYLHPWTINDVHPSSSLDVS